MKTQMTSPLASNLKEDTFSMMSGAVVGDSGGGAMVHGLGDDNTLKLA